MRRQKLKIGPYEWTFINNSLKLSKSCLGECDYSKLTISIAKTMPPEVRKATILHELFHAFVDSSGLKIEDEESVVDTLANQLLFFIQNNPKFFKKNILS